MKQLRSFKSRFSNHIKRSTIEMNAPIFISFKYFVNNGLIWQKFDCNFLEI